MNNNNQLFSPNEAVYLKLDLVSKSSRGLVKTQTAGLPRHSLSRGPWWGLRICILTKFQGDTDAASLGAILRGPLLSW